MTLSAIADELEAEAFAMLDKVKQLRALDKEMKKRPALAEAGSTRRIIPLSEWPEHHPWPTVNALKQYVFFEKTNGASAWVIRRGRRVLIDETAFLDWAARSGPGCPKPRKPKKAESAEDAA